MTVLVDTSVWVDHLRRGRADLSALLDEGAVLAHPFVVGELACGSIRGKGEVLGLFAALPQAVTAGHEEAMVLIERLGLHGRGVGWIDVHLLASALLTGCPLWTLDRVLNKAAVDAGAGFTP